MQTNTKISRIPWSKTKVPTLLSSSPSPFLSSFSPSLSSFSPSSPSPSLPSDLFLTFCYSHTCTYTGRGSLVLVGGITKNKTVSNDVFLFSLGIPSLLFLPLSPLFSSFTSSFLLSFMLIQQETQKWVPAKVKGPLPRLHSHSCVFVESEAELWLCGGKGLLLPLFPSPPLPLSPPSIPLHLFFLYLLIFKKIYR